MKLAPLRRRTDDLPGTAGVARLDRRTSRLAARLNAGDIAIIDHADLDRVSAEALVSAGVAAVVNAQPSITGRYPNLGPDLLIDHGVLLLDGVGSEVFAAVREGTRVRIEGDGVYLGDQLVAEGTRQDRESIAEQMTEARDGLSTQLESFAATTGEFLKSERSLFLDGIGMPDVRTRMAGRHVVVVVRGYEHAAQLRSLRSYLREFRPVLVGVDGGADALLEAGLTPQLIVAELDSLSDAALTCGAEVVAHTYPDGRAPGLSRAQDLGVDAIRFAAQATSEDLALLLADHGEAELIVSVGSRATMDDFLDRGRSGMASAFLTRLRVGGRIVEARTVTGLYRTRISAAALLLLVLAALVAIIAALAVSEVGRTYLDVVSGWWDHAVTWIEGLFS